MLHQIKFACALHAQHSSYLFRLVVLDGDDTGEAEPVDDRLPRFLALWLRAEGVASWPPSG